MKFDKTTIEGIFVIDLEKKEDNRGFLARSWDSQEFIKHGLPFIPVEGYTCFTRKKGTLRGFHFIVSPYEETKLTRVIKGSIFEVVLDLRPASKTYMKYFGISIRYTDYKMITTPPGCAHAILTLEDNCEYQSLYSPKYNPSIERGIRYNDPTFSIKWPIDPKIISEKDLSWPDFKNENFK